MPKPMCVRCQCFYRPKKNGVGVVEGMPVQIRGEEKVRENEDIRGRRRPEAWSPYKLWVADLWECPDCGHELIVGWASAPVSEHYKPEFKAEIMARRPVLLVNDC